MISVFHWQSALAVCYDYLITTMTNLKAPP